MRGTSVRISFGILMLWLTTGCSIYRAGNAVSDYAVSDLGPLFFRLKTSRWAVRPDRLSVTFF